MSIGTKGIVSLVMIPVCISIQLKFIIHARERLHAEVSRLLLLDVL